jgi:hypothetical protein
MPTVSTARFPVRHFVSAKASGYAKRDGIDDGIIRGIYRFAEAPDLGPKAHRARLVGSGAIIQQVIAARDLLAEKAGIAAEIYSAPSFPLLRRDALEAERANRLDPKATPRVPYVSTVLGPDGGPIIAATDWMKALPDMVSRWLPPYYVSLGTDGFGRSDTREALTRLLPDDLHGGTFTTGSLDTGGSTARFLDNWTGGTLNITSASGLFSSNGTVTINELGVRSLPDDFSFRCVNPSLAMLLLTPVHHSHM